MEQLNEVNPLLVVAIIVIAALAGIGGAIAGVSIYIQTMAMMIENREEAAMKDIVCGDTLQVRQIEDQQK